MRWLLILLLAFPGTPLLSHPGRTDSSGCHTCRTHCEKWGLAYGEYHCHQAKSGKKPKHSSHKKPKKRKAY